MVAVDVLKVPISLQGNEYILVAQDYFSKWPFTVPMLDQKAERIVRISSEGSTFHCGGTPREITLTEISAESTKI